ncbi:putative integral membrane protein [Halovivax ruber XH-70]|uniref:Putative integral membrane protein n=1 Tax=Halovivax ruber (strain DSM 18193 / JCM 13892 / XH-70) TaxID=797302 RepID=L0I6F4_HALRX|nr:TMEM175 family protein [Halovivax ruber]AGB15125.1 putative integral membrane protein [Halovivax ruber XH-70]
MVALLGGDGTDRIEALTDGVLAIVLTLLVLQFEVPDVAPSALPAALADQETLVVSYVLSFAIVGLYWTIHHSLFRDIVEHDRLLLWLNLCFLLSISFLPYPTEVLGTYGTTFAWILYAVNLSLVGITLTAVWAYAAHAGFTSDRIDARLARLITIRGLISPATFTLSIAVATVNLSIAYVVPLLIAPLQLLWVRYYGRATEALER